MNKELFSNYDDILSVDEVAKIFHISKPTVYSLLRNNEIRHLKIGKKYIIPKQSVINFITAVTEKLI